MTTSTANPPCPKCASPKVNRISHPRPVWPRAGMFLPRAAAIQDFRFYCERCSHAWRAPREI